MMTVTETSFHRFESKFAALVRRAAKLGLPAPAFDAVKTFVRRESAVTLANPEGLVPAREITFHGLAPKVNGYTLVCTLDHVTLPGQTLVRFVPGVEMDVSAFCARGACCEHCNTDRRRNSTLVFRTPEGGLTQIGRNCAADFLRSQDIEGAIRLFEASAELDDSEERDGGVYGPSGVPLEGFLRVLVWTCEKFGYMSKSRARDILTETGNTVLATSDHVIKIVTQDPYYCASAPTPKAADLEAAAETAEEIRTLLVGLSDESEFTRTLRLLAQENWVPYAYAGHMAYAYALWQKSHEEKVNRIDRKHLSVAPGSKFKGALTARVLSAPVIETQFGAMVLLSMQTEDGSVLLWKSGTAPRLRAGAVVELTAFKVKEHSEYKGSPQTLVTHVKLIEK